MNSEDFPAIATERARALIDELDSEAAHRFLGFRFEEVRRDYARCRLTFRPELRQYAGVVQGGIVAALIDSTVIGAVLSRYDVRPRRLATLSLAVQFLEPVDGEDVIAEARVRRRGRTVSFLDIEARAASGREVAHGEVVILASD